MSKTKSKNDMALSRDEQRGFVLSWIISHIAFWMVMWALIEFREYRPYAFNTPAYLFGIPVITFIATFFQKQLIERFFHRFLRDWLPASFLGAFLSVIFFHTTSSAEIFNSAVALLMPISLVQGVCLWRHVKAAWLWPLASLIGVLMFTLPFRDYDALWEAGILPFFVLFLGLMHGALQAIVMRHLWMRSRETKGQRAAFY